MQPDPSKPRPLDVRDVRFLKLLAVAARKAKPMGLTVEQYLLGIVIGNYPPIPPEEIDREPEPQ